MYHSTSKKKGEDLPKAKIKRFVARVSDKDNEELDRIVEKIDISRAAVIRDGTLKEAKRLEKEFDKENEATN